MELPGDEKTSSRHRLLEVWVSARLTPASPLNPCPEGRHPKGYSIVLIAYAVEWNVKKKRTIYVDKE